MFQHSRDLLISCFVILLSLFVMGSSLTMERRGDFIESPGIFPGLISVFLLVLGVVYAIRSLRRGGRLQLGPFLRSVVPLFASKQNRPVLLGILFPGLYVFVGIPFFGFYISSAIFMTVMFYAYVTKWRRWFFLPVSLGVTVCLYLIFNKLFMLQIW
jgi:hypothetical protein